VVDNCTIPAGQNLTIAPGTTLLFAGHFFFYVYGGLEAMATATDSIKFLPYMLSPNFRHGGLRFVNSTAASHLAYWRIDNAYSMFIPDAYGGCMHVENATVTLSHSRMTNSRAALGGGIYAASANLTIANCEFVADTASYLDGGGGVYALNSQITVSGSVFRNNRCIYGANGGGIALYSCDQAEISYCIITENSSSGV